MFSSDIVGKQGFWQLPTKQRPTRSLNFFPYSPKLNLGAAGAYKRVLCQLIVTWFCPVTKYLGAPISEPLHEVLAHCPHASALSKNVHGDGEKKENKLNDANPNKYRLGTIIGQPVGNK